MQPIIYDVAISMDGFIAGAAGDVTKFPYQGAIVDDYMARLETYTHCLMGSETYKFGYQFGLKAGDNPYPTMQSIIFSKSIALPTERSVNVVTDHELNYINQLKQQAAGPIYLCGGGKFAGWLLANGLIDILRLKRAPILLSQGVKLFGDYNLAINIKHINTKSYEDGGIFQEFEIVK